MNVAKLGTTVLAFRPLPETVLMAEDLLEEFLEGAASVSDIPVAIFDRALSRDELFAVEELMTVGEGLAID